MTLLKRLNITGSSTHNVKIAKNQFCYVRSVALQAGHRLIILNHQADSHFPSEPTKVQRSAFSVT